MQDQCKTRSCILSGRRLPAASSARALSGQQAIWHVHASLVKSKNSDNNPTQRLGKMTLILELCVAGAAPWMRPLRRSLLSRRRDMNCLLKHSQQKVSSCTFGKDAAKSLLALARFPTAVRPCQLCSGSQQIPSRISKRLGWQAAS